MLLSRLIKKIRLTILSVFTLLPLGLSAADPIGNIVEHTGTGSITREAGVTLEVSDQQVPDIVINDTAETENGRMLIEFLDKAELSLTENTKVYIDSVY